MVATAIYSVTMVLWKETAFPLCRAMERRWKRNVVSRVSSVIVVIRLPISCVSSIIIIIIIINSNLYRIKPAVYEHPHDGSTFTILNRRPWRVQHSIMMNAMWQRFDQSAKQLIVGHTTKISIYRRADRIAGRTTPTRCWHPAQYTAQWYNAPSRVSANRLTSCRHNTVPLYTTHWHGPPEHVIYVQFITLLKHSGHDLQTILR